MRIWQRPLLNHPRRGYRNRAFWGRDFTRRQPDFTPRSGISRPHSGYFTEGALLLQHALFFIPAQRVFHRRRSRPTPSLLSSVSS